MNYYDAYYGGQHDHNGTQHTEDDPNSPPTKKPRPTKSGLPVELLNITLRDKDKFELAEEIAPKECADLVQGQEYTVAVRIKVGDNVYVLDELHSLDLRDLATRLGIKLASRLTKFVTRYKIAEALRVPENMAGTLKGKFTEGDVKIRIRSSICRLINVIFSPRHVDDFRALKGQKKKDVPDEVVVLMDGDDPSEPLDNATFWAKVVKTYHSTNREDEIGVLWHAKDQDTTIRKHVRSMKTEGRLDPSYFVTLTATEIEQYVDLLLKVKLKVDYYMKMSKENRNDPMICMDAALLMNRCKTKIGRYPAYYFFVNAQKTAGFRVIPKDGEADKPEGEVAADDDSDAPQTPNQVTDPNLLKKLTQIARSLEKSNQIKEELLKLERERTISENKKNNVKTLAHFYNLLGLTRGSSSEQYYMNAIKQLEDEIKK
jgi:hypothetical protein